MPTILSTQAFRVAFLTLWVMLFLSLGGTVLFARTQTQIAPTGSLGPDVLRRPQDLDRWVTLGTTLRMHADDPARPDELRHVQVEPGAYARLQAEGAFPDGSAFAVTFYGLKKDEVPAPEGTPEPLLYAQEGERLLGLEVLDARHPDGRRFFVFRPGDQTSSALPAGNACATCHTANAAWQGTFAQHYPVLAPVLAARRHSPAP